MNIMAASNKDYSNTSINYLLDPQNLHHHHPQQVQFSPQLEFHEHNQMAFTSPSSSSHPHNTNSINDFMRKYGSGAYELADYDKAFLFLSEGPSNAVDPSSAFYAYDNRPQSPVVAGMIPPTLNIFPSQPMHSAYPSCTLTSTTKVSATTTTILSPLSNYSEGPFGLPNDDIISNPKSYAPQRLAESSKAIKHEGNNEGPSSTAGQDHHTPLDSKVSATTTTILSPLSNYSEGPFGLPNDDIISNPKSYAPQRLAESSKAIKHEGNNEGPSSTAGQDHHTPLDSKALRRLAQNREAARKSRVKRKAYVQELETSRLKLTELEKELKELKAQDACLGGIGKISQEAVAFNMDYAKWLEDSRLHMGRLRDAVERHLSDDEIRFYVESCITHFDDLMHRKGLIVKEDVFHVFSGMWKTPTERCFMWIGGFRPSYLVKMIPSQIQPLTQQQYVRILELENAIVEAEESLSKDLVKMNQSLSQVVSEDLKYPKGIANYMGQMAASMEKLSNLEVIVHQADNLRQEAIHRVHGLMTTRQASKSLMAIGEYFNRLQSLSALWATRERNT